MELLRKQVLSRADTSSLTPVSSKSPSIALSLDTTTESLGSTEGDEKKGNSSDLSQADDIMSDEEFALQLSLLDEGLEENDQIEQ